MSSNWKKILVLPLSTIQDVLKVIDSESLQLALVVDLDNRLLGTVTDGDIRRALISGVPLSRSISEIMSTTPTVVDCSTSKSQILELMNIKQLHSIPILDDGIVVGLETFHQITQKVKYDNPVFLMAGGFGTRLKPLTDNCPKPLLKVGDKPILETVLLSFIKSGFHDFYISTHYLPEMIHEYFGDGTKWGVSINYVHEEQPLGTGGALGLLPKDLPELPVIMMNGDVLTKVNLEALLAFHNENSAYATMCVREYEYQVPFGVIESEGNNIKSMVEKPIQRFHVNAGIYVVSRKIIEQVNNNEVVDMPTLLERYLGQSVLMFPFYEYWLDIGRMDDFNRAQIDIKTLGITQK
ncbi:nucleotidyltransferase family protein [Paraglaciecola polaris]|uniref:Mannose-1-phosphate guanylyltransferase n=1 Tax=Paraglaciecola polaris LMG 21857 TaxID=1129793 RepID=K6YL59_9ALTE|nr:nucleotidyltransferase family protein [Paraglaciecola polaris]GAC33439.1 mannose-1-phosphate guanylyltransferase [Paraglaciecola polaris LMG 21857]